MISCVGFNLISPMPTVYFHPILLSVCVFGMCALLSRVYIITQLVVIVTFSLYAY